jgi:hypothetical protein
MPLLLPTQRPLISLIFFLVLLGHRRNRLSYSSSEERNSSEMEEGVCLHTKSGQPFSGMV